MSLPSRVLGYASRYRLWTPETPVFAAVSGGADSVALLLVLHELAAQGHVRLAGVAHLNHHIRGADAAEDAAFVSGLAGRLGLRFERADEDVPALARAERVSLEVAARKARLAFFERLSAGAGAPLVALGHTRTDQAETVVLRLVRGAGSRGLSGMAPRTGSRVRPLLEESRDTIRAWLRDRGESWREDVTNDDTSIARNHVRHTVLPALARLNPAAETALARAARIQAADHEILEELAAAEAGRLLRQQGKTVQFEIDALRRLPESLARRVVRRALEQVDPSRTPGWELTEAVRLHEAGTLETGRTRLELFGRLAVLSIRGRSRPARSSLDAPPVALSLEVPGWAAHPAGWWRVEAEGPIERQAAPPAIATRSAGGSSAPHQVAVDAGAVGRHLTIRSWLPGDRVQPLGLAGRKKLQDVFVDRKVPRDERVRVPVVVDAAGRIVWVAGHVVGEPFRVTPRSDGVVVLTLRR